MSRRNLWNYDSIDFLKNMPIPVCGAQVCLIRRKDFLELLTRYPSISLKLLEELNRRVSSLEKQGLLLKKGGTSHFWIPTPLPKCSGKNKRRAFFTVLYCKSIRAHPFFRHYYPKIAPEIWHRNAKYPIALFPFLRYNVTGRKGFFLRIFVQSRHILCSFLSYIGSHLSISGVDMQAAGFFTRRNYKCWKN